MFKQLIEALQGVLTVFRKRRPLSHKDTGNGTTFKTLDPKRPFKLLEVRIHLTGALAAAETFSLTRTRRDAASPAEAQWSTHFNHVIYSNDMGTAGSTSLTVAFEPEEGIFDENDIITPALSANTGSDTWGLEIIYELV